MLRIKYQTPENPIIYIISYTIQIVIIAFRVMCTTRIRIAKNTSKLNDNETRGEESGAKGVM